MKLPPLRDCQKLAAYIAAGAAQLAVLLALHGSALHVAQAVAFIAGALAVYQVPPAGTPRPVEGLANLLADFIDAFRATSPKAAPPIPSTNARPMTTSTTSPDAPTTAAGRHRPGREDTPAMYTATLTGNLPDAASEQALIAKISAVTSDPASGCTGAGGDFSFSGAQAFTLPVVAANPLQQAAAALQDILARTAGNLDAQAIAADVNQAASAVAALSASVPAVPAQPAQSFQPAAPVAQPAQLPPFAQGFYQLPAPLQAQAQLPLAPEGHQVAI